MQGRKERAVAGEKMKAKQRTAKLPKCCCILSFSLSLRPPAPHMVKSAWFPKPLSFKKKKKKKTLRQFEKEDTSGNDFKTIL